MASKDFFSKTKTEMARMKQSVMVKAGKAEETVDLSFNQDKDKFVNHYKRVKKLQKDLVKFLEVLRELSDMERTLSEDFHILYGSGTTSYNAALKFQDVVKVVDTTRTQYDAELRTNVLEPLSKYIAQFKEVKERIAVLETRRIDMDRYTRDAKSHANNGRIERQSKTEHKLEAAKTNYYNLKTELMHDMPALLDDRQSFFDPCFATLLTGLAMYSAQKARSTAEVAPMVAHINRTGILEHAKVITPAEISSAKHPVGIATPDVIRNRASGIYTPTNPSPSQSSDFLNFSTTPPNSSYQTYSSSPPAQQQQPAANAYGSASMGMAASSSRNSLDMMLMGNPTPMNNNTGMMGNMQMANNVGMMNNMMSAANNTGMMGPPASSMAQNRASVSMKPTMPPRPASMLMGQKRARALYDFAARDATELSFHAGDMITILKTGGDWWEGELNGRRGTIPSNYVQVEQ